MQSIAYRTYILAICALTSVILLVQVTSQPASAQTPPSGFNPNSFGPPPIRKLDSQQAQSNLSNQIKNDHSGHDHSGHDHGTQNNVNQDQRPLTPAVPSSLGNQSIGDSAPNRDLTYNQTEDSRFGNNDLRSTGNPPNTDRFGNSASNAGLPNSNTGNRNTYDSGNYQLSDQQYGDNRSNDQSYGQQQTFGQQNRVNNPYATSQDYNSESSNSGSLTPSIRPRSNSLGNNSSDSFNNERRESGNTYIDPMVQPANFQSGFANQQIAQSDLAEQLLKQFDVNLIQTALPGDPISLMDTISKVSTDQRQAAVSDYWKVYSRYAKMRFVEEELYWLDQLRAPAGQADQMLLNAAKENGQNRVMQSELDFEKAQSQLSSRLPDNQHGLLPLPSDMPLLGRYRTNFEYYQSRRSMPQRLKHLNDSLPKQHLMIHANARAANLSRQAVNQSVNAYNQGQATLAATLESIRLCGEIHNSFANSVNEYNQLTTEYAYGVAPFGQAPQKMVAMLIKTRNDNSNLYSDTRTAQNDSTNPNPVNSMNGSPMRSDQRSNLAPANQVPSFNSGSTVGQENWSQPNRSAMMNDSSLRSRSPGSGDLNQGLPSSAPPFGSQPGFNSNGSGADTSNSGAGFNGGGGTFRR